MSAAGLTPDDVLAELEEQTAAGLDGLVVLRDELRDALAGPLDPAHRAEGEQGLAAYDEAVALVETEFAELRWMRDAWRRIEGIRARFVEIAGQLGRMGEAAP